MQLLITGQSTLAAATREGVAATAHIITEKSPDLLWACYDTPIDIITGAADVQWVLDRLHDDITAVEETVPILVSSQLPVGTLASLEREYPSRVFAYSPENIRVATGVFDFLHQARVIVGRRSPTHDALYSDLFTAFNNPRIIFTDPETAEMSKHALNSYLGLCIAFINELGRLATSVGADPMTVAEALLSEPRVSPLAPLKPGAPFGGGHLARDIKTLGQLALLKQIESPLIANILISNE